MSTSTSTSTSTSSPTIKQNLIAVIGTTGVGKSQLAIDLALLLPTLLPSSSSNEVQYKGGAEIINHDSMQVYKGSDIFTNKATEEEMMGIKHHLMGFLNSSEGEEYYVGDFKRDAMEKIDELAAKDTLPIAVGGTTYYLQNLILPNNLVSDVPSSDRPPSPTSSILRCPPPATGSSHYSPPPKTISDIENFPLSLKESILSLPSSLLELFLIHPNLPVTSTPDSFPPHFPLHLLPLEFRTPESFILGIYTILTRVDPDSAKRWHWRDIRKVRRSLEIVWMGRKWNDVIESQKNEREKGEGSRYRSLIFWLWADSEVLNERLDRRIDKMVERGLLEEIQELWQIAGSKETTNYNQGIYQAIGFKEFEPYFASRSDPTSTTIDRNDPLFKSGLERMKISTRQYAKAQIKWIRIKLLPAIRELEDRNDVTVVLLDATDLSNLKESVLDPASKILKDFLTHAPMIDPLTLSEAAALHLKPPVSESSTSISYEPCVICTHDDSKPFLVLESNWKEHLRSRTHRKGMLKGKDLGLYQGKGKPRKVASELEEQILQ